jgi:hypothetical protein
MGWWGEATLGQNIPKNFIKGTYPEWEEGGNVYFSDLLFMHYMQNCENNIPILSS